MWGQGLLEAHKFHTMVAANIQRVYDNTVVNKEVFAHSGAIIGIGDNTVQQAKHGEIPSSYPTILQQVRSYPLQKAPHVDLVLIDGGINDLGILNILFDNSPDNLKNRTSRIFGNDLKILLKEVLEKFSSSRTKIMVTGYYRIVSQYSDVGILRSLGAKLGQLVGSTGVGLIPGAIITVGSILAGAILDEVLKNNAVTNCRVFYDTSVSLSEQVIRELDPTRLKIKYLPYDLFESYAIFTSASNLWGQQPFLDLPYSDDEVRNQRKILCDNERLGQFDYFKCQHAGIGHPNYNSLNGGGAEDYLYGIIGSLFPTPQPCRPLEAEFIKLDVRVKALQTQLQQASSSQKPDLIGIIEEISSQKKNVSNALIKCKHDYYNNNGTLNVGSLLEIVRRRGWTLKPISIRQVGEALGFTRPVSIRHI